MSKTPDIDLAPEYTDDWILQAPGAEEKQWQPAPPLPEGPLTQVVVATDDDYRPEEVAVTSPNGTRVRITADPITGGLRVTQAPQDGVERGLLSTVAMGLGTILLDDRP